MRGCAIENRKRRRRGGRTRARGSELGELEADDVEALVRVRGRLRAEQAGHLVCGREREAGEVARVVDGGHVRDDGGLVDR